MNVSGEQCERKANVMQPEDIESYSYPLNSCHVTPEGNNPKLEYHTF